MSSRRWVLKSGLDMTDVDNESEALGGRIFEVGRGNRSFLSLSIQQAN